MYVYDSNCSTDNHVLVRDYNKDLSLSQQSYWARHKSKQKAKTTVVISRYWKQLETEPVHLINAY